jgi:aspartate-semialdehyde dehydrogenase
LGQQNTTEFSLWTVADNLQFGIVGNLVRVLEILVKDYF